MSEVVIAHHGHCFDGACSAAIFTRYLRERENQRSFVYRGLAYEPNAPPIAEKLVDGAINAILDFRYTQSPLLTWYFDHHVSAFQEPGSKAHFDADTTKKKFHDGTYGSCTKFIADILREHAGWEAPDLNEMIRWADIVDAARFANADVATSLDEPAMAITAVVQECGDDAFCAEMIPRLASEGLAAIAKSPIVESRIAPIRERQAALTERMARAGEQKGVVAHFDLSDQPLDTVAKFVGYKLFPTAMYSVVLAWTPRRAKLSVGFNPWSSRPRKHNIAELCEQYGGGGHPVVGAISLPGTELPKARRVFAELIEKLNT
ncbi:MAG: hypothetical protein JNK05_23085 [Myxococcales bacterium]|nr:hypothetical protein [Myxococcales bacterium]